MTTQEIQMNTPIQPAFKGRILRLHEVKTLTGLSRSSIYAYMKAGFFPQHIKLGARSVGWYESEVSAWITSRVRMHQVD